MPRTIPPEDRPLIRKAWRMRRAGHFFESIAEAVGRDEATVRKRWLNMRWLLNQRDPSLLELVTPENDEITEGKVVQMLEDTYRAVYEVHARNYRRLVEMGDRRQATKYLSLSAMDTVAISVTFQKHGVSASAEWAARGRVAKEFFGDDEDPEKEQEILKFQEAVKRLSEVRVGG